MIRWAFIVGIVTLGVRLAAAYFGAHAHPSPGDDPKLGPWFESLSTPNGQSCCGIADCHEARQAESPLNSPDGRWWVFISRDQFGNAAPDKLVPVPKEAVRYDDSDKPRPPGPVVCWAPSDPFTSSYGKAPTPDGTILCFRPARAAG